MTLIHMYLQLYTKILIFLKAIGTVWIFFVNKQNCVQEYEIELFYKNMNASKYIRKLSSRLQVHKECATLIVLDFEYWWHHRDPAIQHTASDHTVYCVLHILYLPETNMIVHFQINCIFGLKRFLYQCLKNKSCNSIVVLNMAMRYLTSNEEFNIQWGVQYSMRYL